jgi:hypothetical protein
MDREAVALWRKVYGNVGSFHLKQSLEWFEQDEWHDIVRQELKEVLGPAAKPEVRVIYEDASANVAGWAYETRQQPTWEGESEMTPAREAAGYALAALYEVAKHAQAMDTAADRRTALEAACAQSETAYSTASAELKASQHELGRVAADLKAKSAILEDQRARVRQDLNAKVEAAQGELWELQGRIEKAREAINVTERSTESLIRRLRI